MKRFLLFVFSVVLCSLRMCCMNICPQEKYQCVLLCDESEKSMVAYVFMDSHYCLSSVTVSPLDLIDPAQISKVWMVSSNKPKFKECIEKYILFLFLLISKTIGALTKNDKNSNYITKM